MIRTFIFLFCTALFSLTPKHVLSQNDKIVISENKMISIDEIFKIIKSQTDFSFVYHEDLFKGFPKIKLTKGTIRLNKLLKQSLSASSVNVIFTTNNTILIKERNLQEQYQVSGTVTDQLGFPLPGVTVSIKGTNKGTATNFEGNYTITIPDPANVLVFSSLGFEIKEITVGNQVTINIRLKESISALDEVTINAGYYNTSERERTGNISKIDAKIIEKQPVNNPLAAMQGHLPGVNISQKSGVNGGNYRIRIRGSNFFGFANGLIDPNTEINNPLYIIDGVPYNSNALSLRSMNSNVFTNAGTSPLNTINPADIKSIEVLKDADATAIYGSRGANGVILITTKKGRVGKTQIKVNVSTGIGEVTRLPNLMNTQQYMVMRLEALANEGYTLETFPDAFKSRYPDLYVWDRNRYTNWHEVLIGGSAFRQNMQVSFSGGSEHTQFLLSGSHSNAGNVFPGEFKYKNSSVLLNISHKSQNECFKLDFSSNYGADSNDLPSNVNQFMTRASTLAPNAPAIYDNRGNLNWENSTFLNPFAALEAEYNATSYSLIASTSLSYRPIKSLEFKTSLGYTRNVLEDYRTSPVASKDPATIGGQNSSESSIITSTGNNNSWSIEPQINWGHKWKNNRLEILIGATFQQNTRQQIQESASNFPSDALLHNLTSGLERKILLDQESEYRYQAVFGRINFNLKDKYILNLTGRRDGSSRFGPGKRFGNFGAVGVAWIFSDEKVFKDSHILTLGKLRASYGLTGSDNSPDYAFYDTYVVSPETSYNGSALRPTRLFNSNRAWESNKKLEIGLELGLFNNRISISSAWYRNRSSNQLIDVPLPTTTGFSSINTNFDAVVQNSGVEFDLRATSIQKDAFSWRTTFNISANRNKLVSFPGLEDTSFANRLVVGEPLTINKRYNLLGVDPESGLWQYEDYNNDGEINNDDSYLIVDWSPKYTGGLGNIFTYRNLQLDVFFQFVKQKGRPYFNSGILNLGGINQNMPVSILNRWQQPGDQSPIQRYYVFDQEADRAAGRYASSNASVTDASFIRLRNVSLAYRVPKDVVKELDLNIYIQGQNLFLITKYDDVDPEIQSSAVLPPLRQLTLGLNITF
ncbi:SusC/RagA family TonB-linked outer membrane protein [Flavivirga algicola]|uniref:SusC/RagA family TonB-linked outer membrane protein n=1 Tax=Flavivirga algicola TaxID=2729136 RepID=A0ABX1S1I8_9FLAO|nr:SusC/RagA family TonB-linked outer membrane protein [Flavivirga algicola]NMH89696.1 SusC/RagA family TonB-linked outer membrane protein [Flavivirga algicola]